MSTLKVSTISPLGTDATKTITVGELAGGIQRSVFTILCISSDRQ